MTEERRLALFPARDLAPRADLILGIISLITQQMPKEAICVELEGWRVELEQQVWFQVDDGKKMNERRRENGNSADTKENNSQIHTNLTNTRSTGAAEEQTLRIACLTRSMGTGCCDRTAMGRCGIRNEGGG